MTTTELPPVIAHDGGRAISWTEIAEPGFLFVGRHLDVRGGKTWLSVYRSTWLRDDDDWLQPVRGLTGQGRLVRSEIVEDDSMVFGAAELSVYEVADEIRPSLTPDGTRNVPR